MFLLETVIQTPDYFDNNRARRQLEVIHGVAHTLRDPITAIQLFNAQRDAPQSATHIPIELGDTDGRSAPCGWFELMDASSSQFGGVWVVPKESEDKDTLDALLQAKNFPGNTDLVGEHHLARAIKVGRNLYNLKALVQDGSGWEQDSLKTDELLGAYSNGFVPAKFIEDLSTLICRARYMETLTR